LSATFTRTAFAARVVNVLIAASPAAVHSEARDAKLATATIRSSQALFEKTRQKPSKLVLMLRGIAKDESTARLARELSISRKHMHKVGHRVLQNLFHTRVT